MPVAPKRGRESGAHVDLIAQHLAQGVSRQPVTQRFPGQVENAENAVFDVALGAVKRPGTRFFQAITGLTAGANYRVHPIDRDDDERYIVVYGAGVLRVFDAVTVNEATVSVSPDAQAYLNLNSATADQIRLVTLQDTTFIVNTTVPVATKTTESFVVSAPFTTYERMTATTPADQTYHQTTSDSAAASAGYWKYDVDGVTFCKRRFNTMTSGTWTTPNGSWDNSADSPHTFRVRFGKYYPNFTGGTWTHATRRLVKTGAFAGMTDIAGMSIKITGGTGVTAGWRLIASRISDDEIELSVTTGFTVDNTDTSATSIGPQYDMSLGNDGSTQSSMHEVAARIQSTLQGAGASDALVAWTFVDSSGSPPTGYFTITSPYRGSAAQEIDTAATGSGTDLTAAGAPFEPGGSLTAGTGSGTRTLPVEDRWNRAPAPNQADGQPDADTMPVRMQRTLVGPPATFTVTQVPWSQRLTGSAESNPSPKLFRADQSSGFITAFTASNDRLTSVGHGLSVGDSVLILDSGSTPSTDGVRTVAAVPTPDTFTVGVDITADSTSSTARWYKNRVPVSDMALLRSRLWLVGDGYVVGSATNDLFNFYLEDAPTVSDSDPVNIQMGSEDVVLLDFIVPVRRTLALFARAGRQFELSTPDAMTPSTAAVEPTTKHRTLPATAGTKPRTLSSILYFTGPTAGSVSVWEYIYDDLRAATTAIDVSRHVPGYLPTACRTMVSSPNDLALYVLDTDDPFLTVYRSHWSGTRKEQSAWGRFRFDDTYRIVDVAVLAEDLWILSEIAGLANNDVGSPTVVHYPGHGLVTNDAVFIIDSTSKPTINGQHTVTVLDADRFTVPVAVTIGGTARVCAGDFILERMRTNPVESARAAPAGYNGWPYAVKLDRQIYSTGTYSAATNLTTWTMPANLSGDGSTLNRVVLGAEFPTFRNGKITAVAPGANATVTSIAHGLTTGDTVVIEDTDCIPTIDGNRVVTVTGPDTYTVPVLVGVAGTRGTWTRPGPGGVIELTTYTPTTVAAPGDWSAGEVCLGRFYDFILELSQPFVRDESGRAMTNDYFLCRRVVVSHRESGPYSVSVTSRFPGFGEYLTTLDLDDGEFTEDDGLLDAMAPGRASDIIVTITSSWPTPLSVAGVQYVGEYASG